MNKECNTLNIACISAFPRNMNFGMLSVDLSFKDTFDRVFDNKKYVIEYFNIEEETRFSCEGRLIHYNLLYNANEQLKNFNIIVIWGDFTTSYGYLNDVRPILMEKHSINFDDSTNLFYKNYLFENYDISFLKKTFILSNSLLQNSIDIDDSRYIAAIKRLYSNASIVMPRDPISTLISKMYSTDSNNVFNGIDAAFFLNKIKYVEKRDSFGYCFGRTCKRNIYYKFFSKFLVYYITKKTGLNSQKILWEVDHGNPSDLFHEINLIKKQSFIITDVYHCAINSLRESIPTICLGEGRVHQRDTLSDKKKEYLYNSLFIQKLYIFIDDPFLIFKISSIIKRILILINSDGFVFRMNEVIDKQKSYYINQLNKVTKQFF